MEQQNKNMKESSSEDDIKFLTALKPGVTDLRTFLPSHPEVNLSEPWSNIINGDGLVSSISTQFFSCPRKFESLLTHKSVKTRYLQLMTHQCKHKSTTLIVVYRSICQILCSGESNYYIDIRCGPILQRFKPSFGKWIVINDYIFNEIVRKDVINKYCEISQFNCMPVTLENCSILENELHNFLHCLIKAPVLCKIDGSVDLILWINNTKIKQIKTAADFSVDIINLLVSLKKVSKKYDERLIQTYPLNIINFPNQLALIKNPISFDVKFLKIIKNQGLNMLSTKTIDKYSIKKYLLSIHNIFKSIDEILSNHALITKDVKFKYTDLLYEIFNEFYETLNTADTNTPSYMYSINFNICIAKLNMLLVLLIHKSLTTRNNEIVRLTKEEINSDKNKKPLCSDNFDSSVHENYELNKIEHTKSEINFTPNKQLLSSHDSYQNCNFQMCALNKIEMKCQTNDDSVKTRNKIKRKSIRSRELELNTDMYTEVKSKQFGKIEETTSIINFKLDQKKQNTNLTLTKNESTLERTKKILVPSINDNLYQCEPHFEMFHELSVNINSTLHANEPNILKEDFSHQDVRINEFHAGGENVNMNRNHNKMDLKLIENQLSDVHRSQVKRSTLVQNITTVPEFIQLQFKPPRVSRKSFPEYNLPANQSEKSQVKCQKRIQKQVLRDDSNQPSPLPVKQVTITRKSCPECIQKQIKKTVTMDSIAECITSLNEINDLNQSVGDVRSCINDVECVKEVVGDGMTTSVVMHHQDGEVRRNYEAYLDPDRKTIPSDAPSLPHDTWLHGGTLGNKNAVLVFRSSALANATEGSVHSKPGHKLHITYRVVQAETRLLAKLLECHGVLEAPQNINDFNLLWTGSHPKPGVLRSMAPHQRVNHFPRSYELTRKDRLYKNIEKMQHAKGLKHFDFIPQTFLMPTEYKELCSTHHRVKGPWIVKPAASSRGRGIYIVESPNQVPLEEPVVVAKYISKPLLVKGHKCDLRLYVAVTSFDPLLVYIYEEGMVRFATVKYDTTHKQLWNPCMHLCNYSINKYHSDYVKSDDPSAENVGHKWTLSALLRHLKSLGKDTGYLMSQVEDLVVKAILACGNSVITACKMFVPNVLNCFELYGFDILIDENLKPWLLEVNLSPSLGCDSPLDVRLKSAMLSDLLTLVGIPAIDPVLRPMASPTNSSKNLKMKLSNCRRVHSADGLSNTLPKKSGTNVTLTSMALTAEDIKMVKNAKTQFERRGGFVRIFPTVDSWSKYSQYLEPLTGIPIADSNSSMPFTMLTQHNFNQILYTQLFPDVPLQTPILRNDKLYVRHSLDRRRDASLDSVRKHDGSISTPRQDRYERKLVQGHRSSLTDPKKQLKESHSTELKRQISDLIKSGKRMSQVEARRAFSQYLSRVLKRISSSPDQEGHVEIVLKFLQKASTYLKSPFNVKIPSQKLSDKDRAAVVAKQLNDFLYLYNRETDFYGEMNSHIPKPMFTDFLEHARESDLEEVLILQNIHTVPNKGSQSTSSFQGLLRCLPNLTGSTCFRSPDTNKKGVKVTPLS